MPRIKSVNHIALGVSDMDSALHFWNDLLGIGVGGRQDIPAERSEIAFLSLDGAEIELVRPTDPDSGIAKFIGKRGPGVHHVCLEVDDLSAMMAKLGSAGIRLIDKTPRIAADGRRYAFIHPESTGGVLVELYQER